MPKQEQALPGVPRVSEWPGLSEPERERRQLILDDIARRVAENGPRVARNLPNRGAQFAPFAALEGYGDLVHQTEQAVERAYAGYGAEAPGGNGIEPDMEDRGGNGFGPDVGEHGAPDASAARALSELADPDALHAEAADVFGTCFGDCADCAGACGNRRPA